MITINGEQVPLVEEFTAENEKKFDERNLDKMFFGLYKGDTESIQIIREGVKDFAGKYSFVWVDIKVLFTFLNSNFGCEAAKCVALQKHPNKQRMKDNGGQTLTAANIKKFLEDDQADKLKRQLKTQNPPAKSEENNVQVFVGSNFESNVRGKNVLVQFYAPWCGICKKTTPDQEKLKAQLDRDDIVIAKIDKSSNDIDHDNVDIKGYPTFMLFKADDQKNPILYTPTTQKWEWKEFLEDSLPYPDDGSQIWDWDQVININGKEEQDSFINSNPIALINFQNPQDAKCQKITPEIKKAASQLKSNGIAVAAVDATLENNKPIKAELGVSKQPTIKVSNRKHGGLSLRDQTGSQAHKAIVKAMLDEDIPLFESVDFIGEIPNDSQIKDMSTFVQFGQITNNLKDLANTNKNQSKFYNIDNQEGQKSNQLQFQEEGILIEQDTEKMEEFVNKNKYPLVSEFTAANEKMFDARNLDKMFFGLEQGDTESIQIIREGVKDFAGKYSFVWVDIKVLWTFLNSNFGCEAAKCAVLQKHPKVWRLKDNGGALTAANIKKFLEDDQEDKLKRWFKSQNPPAKSEENNVHVLVGSNFESNLRGKNAFVFFQAPWCGHCKSSKPEYEKLKDELQRDDIIIAKFDASANDIIHSQIEVTSYPTFQLFKADDYENPIKYSGGRDLNSWKDQILKQFPNEKDVKSDL